MRERWKFLGRRRSEYGEPEKYVFEYVSGGYIHQRWIPVGLFWNEEGWW